MKNPLFIHRKTLALYLSVWASLGSFLAAWLAWASQANVWMALAFSLPLCILFGAFSSSAYFVSFSTLLSKRPRLFVYRVFFIASLLAGALFLLLTKIWANVLTNFSQEAKNAALEFLIIDHKAGLIFLIASILYLLCLFAFDVYITAEQYQQAQLRANQAQVFAKEAELQALRNQINPHFLFNSLNSISALTAFDAQAARSMTIQLAEFFRMTLKFGSQQKIMVANELELCRHFVTIEQIRFGNKLKVDWNIDENVLNSKIPPMLIQPLIENAIKHGIHPIKQGGTVDISIKVVEDTLHIVISNPLSNQASLERGTGTGLRNLHARLASLYPNQAFLQTLRSTDEAQFIVTCVLPLELEQATEGLA
jgi:hypothetical protein